ncbi:tetratricopeptide repeat protein [Parerythrobacter aestuarii]|uniref:tetratricopeptide repeat protein n=1 Tax=Parerythrobacter aestuarii TaxID=3020909 RepID=UPI0024DE1932|nr:tetratricopeptide repeat protein [Parerythrobacter aestuarii]
MTGWLAIIGLAIVAFLAGLLLLKGHRQLWTLLAAVLVFGLAGYAWQGSPSYPAAPAEAMENGPQGNPALVDARREFFSEADVPAHFITVADGFARKGDFERAAQILQQVVAEDPDNGEAWLALSIALTEHARGRLTKPAVFALQRSYETLKDSPAPAFFDGVNALRTGDAPTARDIWADALAASDEDTPGHAFLAERVAGIDQLIDAVMAQQQGVTLPPVAPPAAPAAAGPQPE